MAAGEVKPAMVAATKAAHEEKAVDAATAKPYALFMRYTWDPEKDAVNRRKHGLSLEEGVPALEDVDRDSWIDDRFDYGEERIVTLGLSKEGILYVVSTDWGENWTRIISVRGAENDEIEQYDMGRA